LDGTKLAGKNKDLCKEVGSRLSESLTKFIEPYNYFVGRMAVKSHS
jgi:hypothetical protein